MHSSKRHWGRGASVTRENVMMLTETVEGTSIKQSAGGIKEVLRSSDSWACLSACLFVVVVGINLGLHACYISTLPLSQTPSLSCPTSPFLRRGLSIAPAILELTR